MDADLMDPGRFFTGQVPLLRRMRPIALRLDYERGTEYMRKLLDTGNASRVLLAATKYREPAETTSGSRPGSLSPGGSLSRPVLGALPAWRRLCTCTLYACSSAESPSA